MMPQPGDRASITGQWPPATQSKAWVWPTGPSLMDTIYRFPLEGQKYFEVHVPAGVLTSRDLELIEEWVTVMKKAVGGESE